MDFIPKKSNSIAKLASRGYTSLSGFAKIVGISYPVAMRLKDEGKVKAIPVGGQHRVYRDEVERFLREGNYVGGASAPPTLSGDY